MKIYIYRNTTIEPFFKNVNASFSGYDEITHLPQDVDYFIWFYLLPIRSDPTSLKEEIASIYKSMEFVYNNIPTSKDFIVFTLCSMYFNHVETGNFLIQESIIDFNNKAIGLSKSYSNFKLLDFQVFLSRYPTNQLIDWKFYYLSKTLLNPKLSSDFHAWFAKQISSLQMKRKKCLILDLDNTLWGGVLGEEGINGIKIGGDYPGSAFFTFQQSILELYKSGIILAVCSKNNESDVLEAWEKNPYILIKKENLAAYRINWENKANNIKEIANQLNIGLDSIVFIDDNPSERALIKQTMPFIETPEFPEHPYMLPEFIKQITEKNFVSYKLTDEDKVKTRQYQERASREELEKSFSNFYDYLLSLEIILDIKPANDLTIPRIAQLTQKTNQFNLTTKRYTEAEIHKFLELGYWIHTISVADRFGDSGLTGVSIISYDKKNNIADVDSFLLSCRILGKGIEEVFLSVLLIKLKEVGCKKVTSTYLQSQKNDQVKSFFDKMGFSLTTCDNENKYYTLILDECQIRVSYPFKIIYNEN